MKRGPRWPTYESSIQSSQRLTRLCSDSINISPASITFSMACVRPGLNRSRAIQLGSCRPVRSPEPPKAFRRLCRRRRPSDLAHTDPVEPDHAVAAIVTAGRLRRTRRIGLAELVNHLRGGRSPKFKVSFVPEILG